MQDLEVLIVGIASSIIGRLSFTFTPGCFIIPSTIAALEPHLKGGSLSYKAVPPILFHLACCMFWIFIIYASTSKYCDVLLFICTIIVLLQFRMMTTTINKNKQQRKRNLE